VHEQVIFSCNHPITIEFVPLHFQFASGNSDLVTIADDCSFC